MSLVLYMKHLPYRIYFSGGGSGGKLGEKTQALEQKCFQLQSELTELLRTKGQVSFDLSFIQLIVLP